MTNQEPYGATFDCWYGSGADYSSAVNSQLPLWRPKVRFWLIVLKNSLVRLDDSTTAHESSLLRIRSAKKRQNQTVFEVVRSSVEFFNGIGRKRTLA